ncbi:hypothetical protein [Hufsiella ginkgonis]|uniref:Uncharacterized protein n=1 Tax=Hufsiella ginkgonis TaxID=2695274 RepID=A0A7K1Y0V4_9SPHI|nr:hypothetical protein [Hufsiella ginkgonis]MXV16718.1 hypothetical protein [Hufsiella ginkgonis]
MSSAFIRESEGQNLNEVEPTLPALLFFLRRENGGTTISEIRSYFSEKYQAEVHEMTDGLGYRIKEYRWTVVFD